MNNTMKVLKTSRKLHKWLMAVAGLQFVIWSLTGAYMVFFDIDYIHGDSLVRNEQVKLDARQVTYPLHQLLHQYPGAQDVRLGAFMGNAVYRFKAQDQQLMLNAQNGELLPPLSEQLASKVAQFHYSGSGAVQDVQLITDNPPFELSQHALPAWRVNFADLGEPSLYISAQTGELVGKRHNFWRLFDWMFRFHVMDYDDGEDVDNLLLFCFSFLGIFACLAGLVLVYFRVVRRDQDDLVLPGADLAMTPGRDLP